MYSHFSRFSRPSGNPGFYKIYGRFLFKIKEISGRQVCHFCVVCNLRKTRKVVLPVLVRTLVGFKFPNRLVTCYRVHPKKTIL